MSNPWFLGIDLGTGSCKAMIIDQSLNILGVAASDYGQTVWKEQDPEITLQSLIKAVRQVVAAADVNPADCAGISFGCALHGVMAINRNGKPLSGVMTWTDDRALQQSERIKKEDSQKLLYQVSGCPVHWMYWPYKVLWLKENQPEIYKKAWKFISVKSYILQKLIGEYIIDYSVAGGGGFLDVKNLKWSRTVMDLAGLNEENFSALASPHTVFDGIDPDLAEQMGLPAGIKLVLGASDAANSSLGAGAVMPDQATCMIGTSAALRVIYPKPLLDPLARSWCYPFDDQHWLVGGALNNGGIALSWLKDTINSAFGAEQKSEFSFEDIFRLAAGVDMGANGLIILPYFAGERSPNWSLNSRAVFYGLTLEHDMRHISRALLESISFRLRQLTEVLKGINIEVNEIRTSGGGARSHFWMQILADILGKDICLPETEETSSFGTAIWALKGSGYISDFTSLKEKIGITKTFSANQKKYDVYTKIFGHYFELNELLRPYQDNYKFTHKDDL